MKKIIASSIAVVGMAIGAHAQGTINLDNSSSVGGVALLTAGNYYSGPITVQVWYENGSTIQSGINNAANTAAYAALSTDSFFNAGIFQQTITAVNAGTFSLGPVTLSSITTHASSGVIALVAWDGSQTTEAAAVTAGDHLGVIAFDNAVGDPLATPVPGTPAALSGFTTDLVMTSVPEPTTIALAGLGGAALLAFRRRNA